VFNGHDHTRPPKISIGCFGYHHSHHDGRHQPFQKKMSGIFSIASAVKIMEEFRIYKDDLTETHKPLQSIIEKY
jgi:hypothetical protein